MASQKEKFRSAAQVAWWLTDKGVAGGKHHVSGVA